MALYQLIRAFRPFTFQVIIDRYVRIAILLFFFCRTSLFLSSFNHIPCDWWLPLVLCLDSFLFTLFFYVLCFWFVVTKRFIYIILNLYQSILSWQSLKFEHILRVLYFYFPHPCFMYLMSYFMSFYFVSPFTNFLDIIYFTNSVF